MMGVRPAVRQLLNHSSVGMTLETMNAVLDWSENEIRDAVTALEEGGEIYQSSPGTYTILQPLDEVAEKDEAQYQVSGNESELLSIPDQVKKLRGKWYVASEDVKILEELMSKKESEVRLLVEAEVKTVTVPSRRKDEEPTQREEPLYGNEHARRAEVRKRLGQDAKYQLWEAALKNHQRTAFEIEIEIERLRARHYGLQKLVEIKRSNDWESYNKNGRTQ